MERKHETGKIGEDIACNYLRKNGHRIIQRNYRKFYGEIDIISEKQGTLYFTEVKSRETMEVPRETEEFMPEEHVHPKKLERLARTVQIYLEEQKFEGDWEFLVLALDIDKDKKTAHVRAISDVL